MWSIYLDPKWISTSKIKKLLKSGKEGIIMNFLKKKKNCAHLKSMIPMKSKLELSHHKIYKAIHGVHKLLSLEQEQFLSPMLEYDQIIAVMPKLVCILKSSRDFFKILKPSLYFTANHSLKLWDTSISVKALQEIPIFGKLKQYG